MAFWSSPDRFKVMGLAEYLDRIETGFETAGSLLKRLAGRSASSREHFPRDLVQRLAQQLFLLEKACAGLEADHPCEAFLQVEGIWEPGAGVEENNSFARQLGTMYKSWAEKRRMHCQVLEERKAIEHIPYLLRLAVSGYAAYTLLAREEGFHLLEIPEKDSKSFRRAKVRVRIAPQPAEPAESLEVLREHARKIMTAPGSANPEVARRYRESPSPLVRDNLQGWRTGRLDKVWEGNFDLFPGLMDPASKFAPE